MRQSVKTRHWNVSTKKTQPRKKPRQFWPCVYTFLTVTEMLLPPQELRCLGKSCHRHNGAGKCTAHWGHYRKPAGSRFHGEYPMKRIGRWFCDTESSLVLFFVVLLTRQ